MVPVTPPLIWRLILSLVAWPEAVPVALKRALFPGSGDTTPGLAELAPDFDIRAFALATNGHAKLRAAAGVVGVALEALGPAVAEPNLSISPPGSEEGIEWTGGGPAARPRRKRDGQGQGGQEAKGEAAANGYSHRLLFPAVCLGEQAKIMVTGG